MKLAILLVALAAVVYGVHHLLLRSEGRGEQRHGGSGALGNAFLEVQSMIEPSKKVVLEVRLKEKTEGREDGDPPEGGGRR